MINKQSPIPIYHQLADLIQKQIDGGDLKPGQALPAEREYAERFGISRMTARQALNQLVTNGYLYRIQGKGTFVSEKKIEKPLMGITSFTEEMAARGMKPGSKLLCFNVIPAVPAIADQLQISEGSPVYQIERIRLADDVPMAIETNYISARLLEGLTEEIAVSQSLYAFMEEKLGAAVEEARQSIESSLAERAEAQSLGIQPGAPVMRIERLACLGDGTPAEYVKSTFRADRYKFIVHLRRN